MTEQPDAERLYILGHPVAHSKSPVMYNAVYGKMGLPWQYGFMDCATVEEARAFLGARDFLSINITTPYKPHAFEAATVKAASAQLAHGANVLVHKGGELIGYNTDGEGCTAFLEHMGMSFAGKHVAVCGTGPTALSILHACALAGAESVLLLSRNAERARGVLESYVDRFGLLANATVDLPAPQDHHRSFREAYDRTHFRFGSYTTSTQAIAAADLVVNATPVGMRADDDATAFDPALLSDRQVVFDAVYASGTTALVRAARETGCVAYDGGGMLVAQAVATVYIVCQLQGIEVPFDRGELFDIMADAAAFEFGERVR